MEDDEGWQGAEVHLGIAMLTVMTTLPAATVMVTSEASTPTIDATVFLSAEVSWWSATLPLAIRVITTGSWSGSAGLASQHLPLHIDEPSPQVVVSWLFSQASAPSQV